MPMSPRHKWPKVLKPNYLKSITILKDSILNASCEILINVCKADQCNGNGQCIQTGINNYQWLEFNFDKCFLISSI